MHYELIKQKRTTKWQNSFMFCNSRLAYLFLISIIALLCFLTLNHIVSEENGMTLVNLIRSDELYSKVVLSNSSNHTSTANKEAELQLVLELDLKSLHDVYELDDVPESPANSQSITEKKISNTHGNMFEKKDKKKKMSKKDIYDFVVDFESDWGCHGEMPFIKVLDSPKVMIKHDRRVILSNASLSTVYSTLVKRSEDASVRSQIRSENGIPTALHNANVELQSHPFRSDANAFPVDSLEDTMYWLQHHPKCAHLPLFITMATVKDDLYWQLIENFVYTSVKFGTSPCSFVICVSDPNCIKMCDAAFFPCFNYREAVTPLPSVMEQIAKLKLLHIPKALNRGVDVFMLDLDVGFLHSPLYMIQAFYATPKVDILVQEDYIFVMNRTIWVHEGWKKWTTEPLPNIGLFICRGNNRTARVFELAWSKYQRMDSAYEKSQPGKDQSHVLDGMRIGRGNFHLKYAYFSNYSAPLLDKLVIFRGGIVELGGEVIIDILSESPRVRTQRGEVLDPEPTIAMHTTCYEKSTKVMGLKASNAFWNPKYYDPNRRTITKQLLYLDEDQLLDEVRSLIWLAILTKRSLIVPNILGHDSVDVIEKYRGQVMWPGFRVVYLKRVDGENVLKVDILEPSFYWRVNRDYAPIPEAHIHYFDPKQQTVMDIKAELETEAVRGIPRIVLHHSIGARSSDKESNGHQKRVDMMEEEKDEVEEGIRMWANHSVGLFADRYAKLIRKYKPIPSTKHRSARVLETTNHVLQGMRVCNGIFAPAKGNRTCFQICD